jgi:hypothetical protein
MWEEGEGESIGAVKSPFVFFIDLMSLLHHLVLFLCFFCFAATSRVPCLSL